MGHLHGVIRAAPEIRVMSHAPETTREAEREVTERPPCHRRDCMTPAAFRVLERYQEETGQGAVEAVALLCPDHTMEEGPSNLDQAYEGYVFRIDPLEG